MNERIGRWIETYKGHSFYPLDPRPEEICIEDIAHASSNICRYNGHALFHYSIAQHCCMLHDAVQLHLRKLILFHDASEAYLCDIPTPLKAMLTNYFEIEKNVQDVIEKKYNITQSHDLIKEFDNRILADEHRVLFPRSTRNWTVDIQPLGIKIEQWSQDRANCEFLERAINLI
jgi:hypothetical protein